MRITKFFRSIAIWFSFRCKRNIIRIRWGEYNSSNRLGAFTVLSTLIFAFTIYQIGESALNDWNSIVPKGIDHEYIQSINNVSAFLILFLTTAILLHIVRVYISFDLADSEEKFFITHYNSLNGIQRAVELFIRVIVLTIAGFHVLDIFDLKIDSLTSLSRFLKWFYGSLIAWDIIMTIFSRSFRNKYWLTDLSGFTGSYLLHRITNNSEVSIVLYSIVLIIISIFTLAMFILIGIDLKNNFFRYLKHFVNKTVIFAKYKSS